MFTAASIGGMSGAGIMVKSSGSGGLVLAMSRLAAWMGGSWGRSMTSTASVSSTSAFRGVYENFI